MKKFLLLLLCIASTLMFSGCAATDLASTAKSTFTQTALTSRLESIAKDKQYAMSPKTSKAASNLTSAIAKAKEAQYANDHASFFTKVLGISARNTAKANKAVFTASTNYATAKANDTVFQSASKSKSSTGVSSTTIIWLVVGSMLLFLVYFLVADMQRKKARKLAKQQRKEQRTKTIQEIKGSVVPTLPSHDSLTMSRVDCDYDFLLTRACGGDETLKQECIATYGSADKAYYAITTKGGS